MDTSPPSNSPTCSSPMCGSSFRSALGPELTQRPTLDNAFQYSPGAQSSAGCGVWQVLVIGSQNCPLAQFSGSAELIPAVNSDKAVMGSGCKNSDGRTAQQIWHGLIMSGPHSGSWGRARVGERQQRALTRERPVSPAFPADSATPIGPGRQVLAGRLRARRLQVQCRQVPLEIWVITDGHCVWMTKPATMPVSVGVKTVLPCNSDSVVARDEPGFDQTPTDRLAELLNHWR